MKRIKFSIVISLIVCVCMIILFTKYLDNEKRNYISNIDTVSVESDSYSFLNEVMTPESIDFKLFNGHYTLARYENIGDIELTIYSTITYGDLKIILFEPDGNYKIISKGTYIIESDKGLYTLKIVGKDAFGTISYAETRPDNQE